MPSHIGLPSPAPQPPRRWRHSLAFICVGSDSSNLTNHVCSIFVGVPKIAQSKINSATLEVQGVHVIKTTTNAYTLEINSTISTDGTVKADIDPFDGDMSLEDVPNAPAFATVRFPPTTADSSQTVNVSQALQITDMKAFTDFNIAFFQNETLRVRVAGKTKVQPAGLSRKSDVDFVKILDLKGLNLLKGTKVSNASVALGVMNGTNFRATADIPNASLFTLDIVSSRLALVNPSSLCLTGCAGQCYFRQLCR